MNELGKVTLPDGRTATLDESWQWHSDDERLLTLIAESLKAVSSHWGAREYLEWVAHELGGTAEVYRDHRLSVPPGAIT
jgi:hypothetical protein